MIFSHMGAPTLGWPKKCPWPASSWVKVTGFATSWRRAAHLSAGEAMPPVNSSTAMQTRAVCSSTS